MPTWRIGTERKEPRAVAVGEARRGPAHVHHEIELAVGEEGLDVGHERLFPLGFVETRRLERDLVELDRRGPAARKLAAETRRDVAVGRELAAVRQQDQDAQGLPGGRGRRAAGPFAGVLGEAAGRAGGGEPRARPDEQGHRDRERPEGTPTAAGGIEVGDSPGGTHALSLF